MDLTDTIKPKSDQLNADDLLSGPMTIEVTELKSGNAEQPISIHWKGDPKRPYKPSKSMRRVLVNCWGKDGQAYVGRKLRLFCEPSIKWGGEEVGGIRISHLSDITAPMVTKITVRRGAREAYTVQVLEDETAEAELKLRECKTLDELKAAFTSLPKSLQVELAAVKDEMKAAIENPETETE